MGYIKYQDQKINRLKLGGVISLVVAIGLSIYFGFDKTMSQVKMCVSHSERYVVANYSDTILTTCSRTDDNGNTSYYTCTETDYWTKPASPVYFLETINGKITMSSGGFERPIKSYGVFVPPFPVPDQSHKASKHFDGYSQKKREHLSVIVEGGVLKKNSFQEPISKAGVCLANVGHFVTIKTFYGKPYSSDFSGWEDS